SLTGKLALNVQLNDVRATDLGQAKEDIDLSHAWTVADGDAADKAQKVFSDKRSLASGANETLDLTALTGQFGSVSFAKVRGFAIVADPANTTVLTVAQLEASGLPIFAGSGTDVGDISYDLGPGDVLAITRRSAAGIAVTNTTGDTVKVTN